MAGSSTVWTSDVYKHTKSKELLCSTILKDHSCICSKHTAGQNVEGIMTSNPQSQAMLSDRCYQPDVVIQIYNPNTLETEAQLELHS